jgi:hypothetical protein
MITDSNGALHVGAADHQQPDTPPPADSAPVDADRAVQERLAQLGGGLSPGERADYVRGFMVLLLDRHVTSAIARDGYLDQLRLVLKEKGYPRVTLRQLRQEFDRAVAERAGPGAAPQGETADGEPGDGAGAGRVWDFLDGVPVPEDAVVPRGWEFGPGGVFKCCGGVINSCGPRAVRVLPTPLVISGRRLAVEDETELLELRWIRDGRWKSRVAERATVANRNKLLDLAADGLPVTSSNAGDVVDYLAAFENANLAVLPRTRVSRCLGWVEDRRGFLWGHTLLTADGGTATAPPSPFDPNAAAAPPAPLAVLFQGRDLGDEQLAGGFHARGSLEGWRAAVEPFLAQPKFRLALTASLCSPLLDILDVPNPIVELCGDTSRGKTAALRAAASAWGQPNEKSPRGVLSTWDVTRVGVERSLATINNLPLILDDTSRCKHKELIAQVVYDVVAGRGRTRGSLVGTQRVGTWSTALLSSGEGSVNAHAEQGGARARVLTLWGSPFAEVSAAMGQAVKRLNDQVLEHYGHAGPRFVAFLLANRGRWPTWRGWHRRVMQRFAARAGDNPVAGRMADVFATLTLTGTLAGQALGIRWLKRSPVKALWAELTAEAQEADVAKRALRYAYDWARMHEEEFHGRAVSRGRSGEAAPQPHGGWAGRWDATDTAWDFLGFYPARVKGVLAEAGFEADAVLRAWRDRGWLRLDGQGKYAQVRIGGDHPRLVAIRRPALEALDGGGQPAVGDPPWVYEAARLFLRRTVYGDDALALPTTKEEGEVIRVSVVEAVRAYLASHGPNGRPRAGEGAT